MQIKKFTDVDEANAFISSAILTEKAGVQYYDGEIIVFYDCLKDDYESYFVNYMIEGVANNLFNERVRKMAVESELAVYKEKGTNLEGFDDAMKRDKEASKNIELLEAKLATLNEWKAKNS